MHFKDGIINSVLQYLSFLSHFLPIVLFFLRRGKEKITPESKVLVCYILYSIVSDTLLLLATNNSSIFFLLSLYTVIEYCTFSFFLHHIIKKPVIKNVIFISMWGFCLYSGIHYTLGGTFNFDSLPASIEALMIIIFCVIYLFERLNTLEVTFIYNSRPFWMVTAFITYLSGTLFLFMVANHLSDEQLSVSWQINLYLIITKNILFTIGFCLPEKQQILSDHLESFHRN